MCGGALLAGAAEPSETSAVRDAATAESAGVQVAAYYFPNWHRRQVGTNEVFGEWGTLQRAVPRFPGHRQPRRPLWGMEDEADPVVMARKIDAAADHGVSAWIFCWYWTASGPYLERALEEGYLGATNRERLRFALMWANHDLRTTPPHRGAVPRDEFERMAAHVAMRYFTAPTYWRVNGALYFSIYEVATFVRGLGGEAAAREALEAWRARVRAAGLGEIHLNLVDYQLVKQADPARVVRSLGADSVTGYVWIHEPAVFEVMRGSFPAARYDAAAAAYFRSWDRRWANLEVPHFPNVTVGWDSTPRVPPDRPLAGGPYPHGAVLVDNTPVAFRVALHEAITRAQRHPPGRRIVTVYAWNEWTEGGFLEPEVEHGFGYLQAIRDEVADKRRVGNGT
ncbi:MAG: glycoside hydrolase family 99-like domain-containing protein [Kiritimatiellae bacterium]|nr:glycoside hydrolase family 99-like domain-containing protein [Kiritimatiellia bacterium]